MSRDREVFRNRFQHWKNGEKVYNNGIPVAIQEVDKSDADFAKRLRSNWRQEIWDWEGSGKAATHKMGSSDNIVYPNVQTTEGGGLIDFTNPIWKGVVDPRQRAIKNGDYVPMKTEDDAKWFGPNYKKYYPGFKCGKLPRYAEGSDPYEEVVDFLKQHEGYRDKVYLDGNGIPTIGYGFTDSNFINKGTISKTEADAELKRQVKTRQATLRDILGADKWDSLTDDSRKALTSYHYNYPAGFKSNTKFMKAWRDGNYAEAIRQVDAGINDPKNPGLRTRRLAEQALLKADPFLTGRYKIPILPIVEQPVSTAVRTTIPEQYTIPAYDTQVSPYISGKPMLHLMPPVNQPNLIQMVEGSQWKPTYVNGKLPKYEDGTSVLRDVQQEYKKYNVDTDIYYDKIKKDWDNQIQWADNWLQNRAQQFADNIDTYSGQLYRGSSADAFHVAPIPILDLWDRYRFYNARKIAKEQINHAKQVPVYDLRIDGQYQKAVDKSYAIDDFLKMKYGTQGAYYPPTYKNNFKDEEIFIAPDEAMWDVSAPLHEFIHAATNNYQIQQSEIDKIFGGYSKDTGRKYNDKYLDDSNEVYSRLMQFRYDNKLNPNKKVSKQDLNYWRSKHVNGRDLLNRYPDDILLKLFNNVANNTTKNNSLFFAQDGKLPGYADGKIHIKPSKRGTFTAAAKKHGASVREFESRVLKNPEKYSTAMVKKARFSRNARSWKH